MEGNGTEKREEMRREPKREEREGRMQEEETRYRKRNNETLIFGTELCGSERK